MLSHGDVGQLGLSTVHALRFRPQQRFEEDTVCSRVVGVGSSCSQVQGPARSPMGRDLTGLSCHDELHIVI